MPLTWDGTGSLATFLRVLEAPKWDISAHDEETGYQVFRAFLDRRRSMHTSGKQEEGEAGEDQAGAAPVQYSDMVQCVQQQYAAVRTFPLRVLGEHGWVLHVSQQCTRFRLTYVGDGVVEAVPASARSCVRVVTHLRSDFVMKVWLDFMAWAACLPRQLAALREGAPLKLVVRV